MKEKAIDAYGVLDYIIRDLIAASEAFRHFQSPEVRTSLSQHSPAYLNRLCLNHIFIALLDGKSSTRSSVATSLIPKGHRQRNFTPILIVAIFLISETNSLLTYGVKNTTGHSLTAK